MTIKETRMLYADGCTDEFGLILCNIGSIDETSNDEETEIITAKTALKEVFDLLYVEDTAPLKFRITLAKENGTYIDADEERAIKKWLCKKKRYPLQIDQDDLYDTYYNSVINNPRKVNVARYNCGISFDVTCDCGHAWSGKKIKSYTTVGGTLTFNFNNITDYDEYILQPFLTISPTVNGTISIKNNTTNVTTTITNCVTTEILKLDCARDYGESSTGVIILDRWNKNVLEFASGLNSITLTGNFKMDMEYKLPVRVGG